LLLLDLFAGHEAGRFLLRREPAVERGLRRSLRRIGLRERALGLRDRDRVVNATLSTAPATRAVIWTC
jgi:hypothetical protein